MRKKFSLILYPFSILYGRIVWLRNQLFDRKILRSASFDFPLICIGNLSVGGTGKTPMIEYIIKFLEDKYTIATLSRGYKRKTKGFFIADENSSASDIGDEPMQIHKKFPNITVSVAEERVLGIPKLLNDKPETEVILLDDAFQHREVKAGLNILLTDFNNLYSNDLMLPAGNLRDNKKSSKRADIIIVTKCNYNLSIDQKKEIVENLKPLAHQKIYFTRIKYEGSYHLFTREKLILDQGNFVLLVCGIANPQPIKEFLDTQVSGFELMKYNDHHIFKTSDLSKIKEHFSNIKHQNKIILTTEKDGVRLSKFENRLKGFPIYVLPMSHQFLFNSQAEFETDIVKFINSFEKESVKFN